MNDIELKTKLKELFGFENFKSGQQEVVQSILNKTNTIAVLPTGTGKSLCYQMPGALLEGSVIIISPLLSLMQDQVEQLKYQGETRVVAINSTLSAQEKSFAYQNIQKYKYIFVSPEMLKNEYFFSILQKIRIALFVVDEAHCISTWGPDFRPDYLDLGEIKEKLNNPITLALTATATNQTLDEIAKSLRISGNVKIVQRSVNRKNIFLSVKKVENETEKEDMLIKLLDEVKAPGIVYFSSKKKANTILEKIKTKTSLQVAAYHADMDKSERYIIQQQYINNQIDVICATSAFGMGINKKNIRYVIHYHMPSDIESYVQEIGRAGRDGKQSLAILLYANGDEMLQRRILDNTIPQPNEINFYFQNEQKIKNVDLPIYELIGKMKKNFKDTLAMSEFFEKRKKSKIIQIQKMKAYIETNLCKREFLLKYFGELIPSDFHNEKCCIQNAKAIPLEKLNLKSNDKKEKVESDINYLKIINKIF